MTAKGFDTTYTVRPTAPEAELVARAQRGEETAFEALFEAHKGRVYSLCLRMTRNTAEAEDLTQEVFLQVFRKIQTFRGESAFSSWLHRVVVNLVVMHIRKSRSQETPLDEVDTSQEEPVKREYGEDDRQLRGTIDRIRLDRAIAELPPGYRTAFVLHDVQGYEHDEIARMMDWSIGNSKSQVHKARRKLRQRLSFA